MEGSLPDFERVIHFKIGRHRSMTMEAQTKVYLAVDLGATSGRVIAGVWSADKRDLKLETVNRFSSPITRVDGKLHWDILGIYSSIKRGLKLAASTYGNRIESVGGESRAGE